MPKTPKPRQSSPKPGPSTSDGAAPAAATKPNLKDMFAPQEDEEGGGFSLFSSLGGADLDLDLRTPSPEPEPPIPSAVPAAFSEPLPAAPAILPPAAGGKLVPQSSDNFYLLPFLYLPPDAPKTRYHEPRSWLEERGEGWKVFCRDENEEETQKRWDEVKGGLTREYKRRHREAVKRKRRRMGTAAGDE